MKGRDRLFKNEKYFDFPKMDKKMSVFRYSKTLLLTKFFVYIEKFYGLMLNENIKKLLAYFFQKKTLKLNYKTF